MNSLLGLAIYLAAGLAGGLAGSRLKITGGTMIGAMLAVILLKVLTGKEWAMPKNYTFIVQILIGVMVGAGYTSDMAGNLARLVVPVITSTLVLVTTGLVIGLVLAKTGLLDGPTAYLSTSPGAMSALISLAGDARASTPVVMAFHFFRVVFIILTAPLIFYLMRMWFKSSSG